MSKVTPHKVIGPAWSEERVTILRDLWGRGFSAIQIAQQFGDVTRNAVIGKIARLGLQRNRDAAYITNRLTHKLRANTPARKFVWNEDRDDRLTKLFNAGALDSEIAAALVTTPNSVQHRRKALRLLREPSGGFKAAKPPKPAKPKLFICGSGTVMEQAECPAPKARASESAWAPLPGVAPLLREHAKDRHCKWPITVNGDELSWCCSAVATEGPYCASHKRKSVAVNQPDEIKRAKRRAEREKSHARMIFGRAA